MEVERVWWPRLRWRMRGAWQWPAFAVLTLADAFVVSVLPFYGDGPDALGAFLLSGFANLAMVAVAAPLVGWLVRRRRRDLPRMVANDYAGTALLLALAAAFLIAGIAHRPVVAGDDAALQAVAASVHRYVVDRAPAYRPGLARLDAMRVERGLYRACVPGPDPGRWLCLYVRTDQSPPGIARDPDQLPNRR
jgi:hypothetical protein